MLCNRVFVDFKIQTLEKKHKQTFGCKRFWYFMLIEGAAGITNVLKIPRAEDKILLEAADTVKTRQLTP